MPKINVTWQGQFKFAATDESGHTTIMDVPAARGGEGSGPTPLSLILMSVAGCSGIGIMHMLDKMKIKLDSFAMEVTGDRSEQDPKLYTKIDVLYKFTGSDIAQDKIARAIKLTVDKYCPAVHIVNKTAQINYAYQINGKLYQL